MTDSEKVLLDLLKDSIWGASSAYPSDVDWNAVVLESQNQAVLGLVCECLPNKETSEMQDIQMMAQYAKYTFEEDELIKLFDSHSIPIVIIKGAAAAVYYPFPYKRSFGDMDFIVPEAYLEKAVCVLRENGYCRISEKVDEFRHIEFEKNDYLFELHHRFSYDDLDIERYIIEGIDNRIIGCIDDHKFPMFPPLTNGLILLYHLRSHLQKGLGLRQVVDWMMYVNSELNDDYWCSAFKSLVDEIGLTDLAVTTTYMCQKYLGLSNSITWCQKADESLCDILMESLLSSGNFGIKRGSEIKTEKTVTAIKKEGIFSYLQKAGKHNWTAYHNHPILKPFCWIYQIFRYARQAKQQKSSLYESMKRGKQRYEMLKELKII